MLKNRFIDFMKYVIYITEDVDYRKMPYNKYLHTYHWEQLRELKLSEVDHRCQVCYNSKQLNVHHRTYERLGNEKLSDLTVLCKEWHEIFHTNGRLKKHEAVQTLPSPHRGKSRRRK